MARLVLYLGRTALPPSGATVLLLERAEGMLAEFLPRTPPVSLETGGGYRENSRHLPPVIGMTGGGVLAIFR